MFGLIVIAIGLWFFLDRTLGFDLPDIDWGGLWPLILIAIGAWILLGAEAQPDLTAVAPAAPRVPSRA